MAFLINNLFGTAVAVVVTSYFLKIVYRTIQMRRRFSKLPGPPHHPILGHLKVMGEIAAALPKRVHPHVYAHYLREKYNLPPVFYLDIYPVSAPLLVVLHPETAHQLSEAKLNKDPALLDVVEPLAGRENILCSDGLRWKKWRAIFNPGFSVQQLMSQVPMIVDCAAAFVRILDNHAAHNDLFRMEEEATKITIDVIGKAICAHDFKCLHSDDNEFVKTMRKSLSWMPDTQTLNPFDRYNPMRAIMHRYYKKKMDNYIGRMLDERFAVGAPDRKVKKKTAIDLAIVEYFKENGQDVDSRTATMDAEFRQNAINNLEVLLFAGHDTTASTLCYCYALLKKHPNVLAKVCQELDSVFGTEVSVAEQLRQNPYLINDCHYLLAVIKEVLRLWSPASGVKQGRKDYFIKDPVTGDMLPTEDCVIWINVITVHRDPRNWEDPDAFIPERFLSENADKFNPDAYRPFERGPRNCIGQELAYIELKVVLAMTVREFDVSTAFDELESLSNDGSIWNSVKGRLDGPQECFGDEMYQILLAAAKPREGMPARVTKRKR
ncbi:cytochrome P450 [Westerdykella ornata]|uniref:Cytochrome P450 n=1 Tax=Westerdykella ornata TaxID=318751 RepID=A0A6A6JEN5_WESOR|nr:cytochrome P450 [Westerdykella ornata]KAF2275080.1 cytochrome P450 [Westerdykella ornata]